MSAFPSRVVWNVAASNLGSFGRARCSSIPSKPISQPTPTAPGSNVCQWSDNSAVCVIARRERLVPSLHRARLHPGHVTTELPRQPEIRGTLAAHDHAARVALQLETTAGFETATDRQEPAPDTFRARHGVPEVLHRRRVAAGEGDRARGLSVALQRRHCALHGVEEAFDI